MKNYEAHMEKLRQIPICDVADALGMDMMRQGSTWAMRDPNNRKEASSLVLFPGTNRWKRWSGVTQGGTSGGSTIDLVQHIQNMPDFNDAVQWLSSRFSI